MVTLLRYLVSWAVAWRESLRCQAIEWRTDLDGLHTRELTNATYAAHFRNNLCSVCGADLTLVRVILSKITNKNNVKHMHVCVCCYSQLKNHKDANNRKVVAGSLIQLEELLETAAEAGLAAQPMSRAEMAAMGLYTLPPP